METDRSGAVAVDPVATTGFGLFFESARAIPDEVIKVTAMRPHQATLVLDWWKSRVMDVCG